MTFNNLSTTRRIWMSIATALLLFPVAAHANPVSSGELTMRSIFFGLSLVAGMYAFLYASGGDKIVFWKHDPHTEFVIWVSLVLVEFMLPMAGLLIVILLCLVRGLELIGYAVAKGVFRIQRPMLEGLHPSSLFISGALTVVQIPASYFLIGYMLRRV